MDLVQLLTVAALWCQPAVKYDECRALLISCVHTAEQIYEAKEAECIKMTPMKKVIECQENMKSEDWEIKKCFKEVKK